MKKTQKILLGLALLVSASAASANTCGTPRNAFDQVYCSSTHFSQLDKDLNQQYKELFKTLNEAQKKTLKTSQLSWISARDANCSESKNGGFYVNISCANEMMQQRIDFLKARALECSSTGCEMQQLSAVQ